MAEQLSSLEANSFQAIDVARFVHEYVANISDKFIDCVNTLFLSIHTDNTALNNLEISLSCF